jgi:hypothetical protein
MTAPRRAVTTYDGRVYTHRILYGIADRALKRASADKRDFDARLTVALFSALAFEAYINSLIEQIEPLVFAKEREFFTRRNGYAGPRGKLRWLLQRLNASPPAAIEARRRNILALLDLRDELAHTKPISYAGNAVHSIDIEPPLMETQWVEKRTDVSKVRRYLDAVRAFCEWLNTNAAKSVADPHLRQSAFKGVLQSQVFDSQALSVSTRPRSKAAAGRKPLP